LVLRKLGKPPIAAKGEQLMAGKKRGGKSTGVKSHGLKKKVQKLP